MQKIKFRPKNDRVLVKLDEPEKKTASGIILAGEPKDLTFSGEILAIGEGVIKENGDRRPILLNVGDKVMFGKYAYNEIKLDGQDFLIMREDDIIGVLS